MEEFSRLPSDASEYIRIEYLASGQNDPVAVVCLFKEICDRYNLKNHILVGYASSPHTPYACAHVWNSVMGKEYDIIHECEKQKYGRAIPGIATHVQIPNGVICPHPIHNHKKMFSQLIETFLRHPSKFWATRSERILNMRDKALTAFQMETYTHRNEIIRGMITIANKAEALYEIAAAPHR